MIHSEKSFIGEALVNYYDEREIILFEREQIVSLAQEK